MEKNYFEELNSINVSDKIEKKNGLSYLSWAFAWGELKRNILMRFIQFTKIKTDGIFTQTEKLAGLKQELQLTDLNILNICQ